MSTSSLDTDSDTLANPGMVKTVGPDGKVEWKRHKRDTKGDILTAIEEVKNGENPVLLPLV